MDDRNEQRAQIDPLSDEAMRERAPRHGPTYEFNRGWMEARQRADVRLAAVEAAHNGQIQALTKRIEELEARLTLKT